MTPSNGPGLFRVQEEPLDLGAAVAAVSGPDRGAVACFVGIVRNHNGGRSVERIEYYAYPEMAEALLRDIGRAIAEKFKTPHVAVVHRTGCLKVGEASVVVVVAAPHRREALAACSFAIERLKAEVPIWKKEFFAGGEAWIEGSSPEKA